MKKTNKRSYLVIVLIVLLLALAIGYAAFTANLTVNGTATGTGTWDVKFTSATINEAGHGDAPTVTDNAVTVDAKLAYPGDACTVTVNIKNGGNIPAKLTAYTLTDNGSTPALTGTGDTLSSTDVTITKPTIPTDGTEKIAAGATCPVTFTIKWKADSTAMSLGTVKFKISFTYQQDTTEVTPTATHGTHTTN